jgi:DNA-binding CsgD family transcriptional regulator
MKRAGEERENKLLMVDRSSQVRLASDDTWAVLTKYFDVPCFNKSLPEMLKRWISTERSRFLDESDASSPSVPLVIRKPNGKLMIRFLWGGKAAEYDLILMEEDPATTYTSSNDSGLKRRETEILALLSHGKTNAEIALALSISPRTVKKHLEHIYNKLQVHRRSGAVARYFQL